MYGVSQYLELAAAQNAEVSQKVASCYQRPEIVRRVTTSEWVGVNTLNIIRD